MSQLPEEFSLFNAAAAKDVAYLAVALAKLSDQKTFGISAIQRACQLSYGQAFRVVDYGLSNGLLTRPFESYELASTEKGKLLARRHRETTPE